MASPLHFQLPFPKRAPESFSVKGRYIQEERMTSARVVVLVSLLYPVMLGRDSSVEARELKLSKRTEREQRQVAPQTPAYRMSQSTTGAIKQEQEGWTEGWTIDDAHLADEEPSADILGGILRRINSTTPLVPRDSVQKIIIVSHFRSGSSFVGRLLESIPGTFYFDEPLRLISRKAARFNDSVFQETGSGLLQELFRCAFNTHTPLDKLHDMQLVPYMNKNKFLRSLCDTRWRLCFRTEVVNSVCLRAKLQVMRVLRLHMSQLHHWVKANADLGPFKVLHVVRDPRGTVASNYRHSTCKVSKCYRYKTLCEHLREDIKSYDRLKRRYPQKTFRIRFEDLALHPFKETPALFDDLNLPLSESVAKYLRSRSKKGRMSHSQHRSVRSPFHWTKLLSFPSVSRIQKTCADVLNAVGYKMFSRNEEMHEAVPIYPGPHAATEPMPLTTSSDPDFEDHDDGRLLD
ncbi:carbohydrate sulfotransferase 4-like isoform X2 [Ornithodoros turicata]|uniref:carbohydrate sulfotransferase 4-like isoform X2 n=1 Tax=Ornithodoros turicata TaxID=34597 RepID=UPI003138B82A